MTPDQERVFRCPEAIRHNQRRQEHLVSLGLPLHGKTVIEFGAGVGEHTSFFLDRGCTVLSTDGREENVRAIQERYPRVETCVLDVEHPIDLGRTFDVAYCYGLLYHLQAPERALKYMASLCHGIFLLETCVSWGDDNTLEYVEEKSPDEPMSPAGGLHRCGCRPTRGWVFAQLQEHFSHVYVPLTQPNYGEFVTDWTAGPCETGLIRAAFLASRELLYDGQLVRKLPNKQRKAP